VFYAYVDESYTDERYYIAAAIGDADAWACVSRKLTEIRKRTRLEHGTPLDIEFHADELMNGRGAWAPLKRKHREAAGIYTAVLSAARGCGIRFILRGLDIPRLHARYKYPDHPHAIVLGHTLERLHERSRDYHSGTKVTVVADEIATQAQHLNQFEGYQKWGTPGYRSSTLSTIVAPITFAPSHSADGLQIADFGAYLHRRRSTHTETHPQARRSMMRLSSILDDMAVHAHTWEP
jgi:hypothetical protein